MAHVAFVQPPFLGHLNPMAALARALVARGHHVTMVTIADRVPTVEGFGLAAHVVGRESHPPGTLAALSDRMGRVGGIVGIRPVLRDVAAMTDTLCRELPAALRDLGADLVVCDGAEPAGGLVASHLGLPHVTVANALPLDREPLVPPPFVGWRYDETAWGRHRNEGGWRIADRLMRPVREVTAAWARRWSLPAGAPPALAGITQIVPALDFPRRERPDTLHACGPLRDPALAPPPIALPRSRPLVFATLGTLQGGRVRLLRTIADAAQRCGAALVLAHGGRLSPAEEATLPGSPAVHAFVPQEQVLAAAALAVVNGGLNTVLDALAADVRPLVVPIAFEQAAIAARVVRSGAGACLSHRFLSPDRLARAMDALLRDDAARTAAARLGKTIREAGGVERAADVVEVALATGRPVIPGLLPRARPLERAA